jgi:hypothetical protein
VPRRLVSFLVTSLAWLGLGAATGGALALAFYMLGGRA